MRRLVLWILFMISCLPAFGQSVQETKRIEQEEKSSLHYSEVGVPTLKPVETVHARNQRLAYFSHIYDQRIVLRSDACQVLMIFLGLEDRYPNEDDQVKFLSEQKFLPSSFRGHFDTRQPLDKGLAAFMFVRAMHMKGGLVMRLWGPSERYAFHELTSMRMMSQGFEQDWLSGKELVTLFTKAADYLAEQIPQRPAQKEPGTR